MPQVDSDDGLMRFADRYLREAFPNPTRTGCPDDEALQRLAKSPLLSELVITEHISCCSPCYNRYAALLLNQRAQQETGLFEKITYNLAERRVAIAWCTVAVLVLCVCVLRLRTGRQSEPTYMAFTIDLRGASPVRGLDQEGPEFKIQVPRRPLDLTILLPLGTDEELYKLSLRNERNIVWTRQVFSRFNDHVATVNTRLDPHAFAAGSYEMIVESENGTRFKYPLQIMKSH